MLYDDNHNAIENIAKHAFPSVSSGDELFDDIYVYTAAICDIVLNPDYPDLECAKKPLELQFRKFKVSSKLILSQFINYGELNNILLRCPQ
jgi:hypothetical protein